MGFKDGVEADRLGVFLDLDEFGETVRIGGHEVRAVIDERMRGDRDLEMGLPSDGMRIFARTEDVPRRRNPGETLDVSGRSYSVVDWREDMGVSEITVVRAY